jgi:hypothetical protein
MVDFLWRASLLCVALFLPAGLLCGVLNLFESDSAKKRKLQFGMRSFSGLCLLTLSFSFFLDDRAVPRLHMRGLILSARVRPEGKSHRTDVVVRLDPTASVYLIAEGESRFFHPGEQVTASYQAGTGRIRECTFYSASGTREGRFADDSSFSFISLAILGVFAIWSGWKDYRRDPEGRRLRPRYGRLRERTGVDGPSLLPIGGTGIWKKR